jgi:hypothetical protein
MNIIAVFNSSEISFTDIAIIFAIVLGILDRVTDAKGWSRSSKRLREENTDLLRIRAEDKQTIARHEEEIVKNREKISSLEAQINILKERDQLAVLEALKNHEIQAEKRVAKTQTILTEIRDAISSQGS